MRVKLLMDIDLGGFYRILKGTLGTVYRLDGKTLHTKFDTGEDVVVALGREVEKID